MSDPLTTFERLKLHDMAETRAQRRRQQERASAATGHPRRGRGRIAIGSQSTSSVTFIQGHSGVRYNVQGLPPPSLTRAEEGLNSDFVIDKALNHETSNGTYCAFELRKPVSVRIHDHIKGIHAVECTCGGQSPCAHLYVSNFAASVFRM